MGACGSKQAVAASGTPAAQVVPVGVDGAANGGRGHGRRNGPTDSQASANEAAGKDTVGSLSGVRPPDLRAPYLGGSATNVVSTPAPLWRPEGPHAGSLIRQLCRVLARSSPPFDDGDLFGVPLLASAFPTPREVVFTHLLHERGQRSRRAQEYLFRARGDKEALLRAQLALTEVLQFATAYRRGELMERDAAPPHQQLSVDVDGASISAASVASSTTAAGHDATMPELVRKHHLLRMLLDDQLRGTSFDEGDARVLRRGQIPGAMLNDDGGPSAGGATAATGGASVPPRGGGDGDDAQDATSGGAGEGADASDAASTASAIAARAAAIESEERVCAWLPIYLLAAACELAVLQELCYCALAARPGRSGWLRWRALLVDAARTYSLHIAATVPALQALIERDSRPGASGTESTSTTIAAADLPVDESSGKLKAVEAADGAAATGADAGGGGGAAHGAEAGSPGANGAVGVSGAGVTPAATAAATPGGVGASGQLAGAGSGSSRDLSRRDLLRDGWASLMRSDPDFAPQLLSDCKSCAAHMWTVREESDSGDVTVKPSVVELSEPVTAAARRGVSPGSAECPRTASFTISNGTLVAVELTLDVEVWTNAELGQVRPPGSLKDMKKCVNAFDKYFPRRPDLGPCKRVLECVQMHVSGRTMMGANSAVRSVRTPTPSGPLTKGSTLRVRADEAVTATISVAYPTDVDVIETLKVADATPFGGNVVFSRYGRDDLSHACFTGSFAPPTAPSAAGAGAGDGLALAGLAGAGAPAGSRASDADSAGGGRSDAGGGREGDGDSSAGAPRGPASAPGAGDDAAGGTAASLPAPPLVPASPVAPDAAAGASVPAHT